MAEIEIRNEIVKVSQEALQLITQIASLWDDCICNYVNLELEDVA